MVTGMAVSEYGWERKMENGTPTGIRAERTLRNIQPNTYHGNRDAYTQYS